MSLAHIQIQGARCRDPTPSGDGRQGSKTSSIHDVHRESLCPGSKGECDSLKQQERSISRMICTLMASLSLWQLLSQLAFLSRVRDTQVTYKQSSPESHLQAALCFRIVAAFKQV